MAGFKVQAFSGLSPRTPATALPANAASIAENIDFGYGELRSLKGDFKLTDLGFAAESVWSEDGLTFYAWPDDVDAIVSPLQSGAASDWIYYTTSTDFLRAHRSTTTAIGAMPNLSYRVGVPRPTGKLAITVVDPVVPAAPVAKVDALPADTYATRLAAAQATLNAQQVGAVQQGTYTRAYTFTYANPYEEEGPPADPVTVNVKYVTVNNVTTYSTVTLQLTFDPVGPYVPFTGARIYRTSDGGTTTDYYYAMTIGYSGGSVTAVDDVAEGDLNEVLDSINAYPPDPALKGLMNVGNGILSAWKGNELWFSDPYRPWSWPPSYMLTFGHSIVGALPYSGGALVTTTAAPWMVSGVSPDAMGQISLGIPQAGVSKWSMLAMKGVAMYACNDGIMMVNGGQPDMSLSERFFTRQVWQQLYGPGLASMEFAEYDGKLIVFSKANVFPAFMLEIDEAGGAMTTLPSFVAKTSLVLVTSDQMYTVNGTALNEFGGGNDLPLHWRSGDNVLPRPMVLGKASVECDGTFTIQFYQKGRLGYTITLAPGATTFSLPSQPIPGHAGLPASDRWQFDITGSGTLKWLKAAPSGRELATL